MSEPIFRRLVSLFVRELPRLFRFGIIGVASLATILGLYGLLSRVVWPSGPRTFQYVLVLLLVTWLNYEANRSITFRAGQRSAGSMGRFATVAVVASGLNSALFWIGHEVLGFWDFLVIVVDTCLVAFFTFSSHRLFTFHPQPWRHLERFRARG